MICSKCESPLDSRRATLGFNKCVKCSDIKKYSSHTVYPHKTGGYIQPVSEEQSDHLKKLDRRRVGSNRVAKGIFADNSWDRWLEQYQNNIYNKRPKIKLSKKFRKKFSHMNSTKLHRLVVDEFIDKGYHRAVNKVNELYSKVNDGQTEIRDEIHDVYVTCDGIDSEVKNIEGYCSSINSNIDQLKD